MTEPGGGASRSTEPARGTSAGTDVSLREHVSVKIGALDRHLTHEIAGLRREVASANRSSERAIAVAADEARERLAAHNGLIEQMREQASRFASRDALESTEDHLTEKIGRLEHFQARITGGLLLLTAIGVANLVKVWTG